MVQSFTTMLITDVNKGHSVMLIIPGHWLLIAKIQDEITCFEAKQNGFCVFSYALRLWKDKKRLDDDELTTSLMKYFRPNGDSDDPGREVCHVTGVKSFARVMEIESMSWHIYESATKEG